MTDQYTPSKHLVGYAYVRTNAIKAPEHELWDEYHGFIAAIEAAAEQRGEDRGLQRAVELANTYDGTITTSQLEAFMELRQQVIDQKGAQDG